MDQLVSPKQACLFYNVSYPTLRRWEKQGKIICSKTSGGHRRYKITQQAKTKAQNNQKTVLYARVSSKKQEKDLQHQILFLQQQYPGARVIKDIASGLNSNRKGFKTILEQLFNRDIKEVVVTHRDRFTRFGFELFEWIFQLHGAQLTVLDQKKQTGTTEYTEPEMVDDIMSIITHFSAKYYGSRKYKLCSKNQDLS